MSEISPTQRSLEPADVVRLVRASFGPQPDVLSCVPVTGGSFAAVWRVELADGRSVVLKTSPPPRAALLGYERDLLSAESDYYTLVHRCAPGVPVPRVLHYGRDLQVLDGDWMFMTHLPGLPLAELAALRPAPGDASVRTGLGSALASLHAVVGPQFGYSGGRVAADSWYSTFLSMIDELLADASRWEVELPATPARLRAAVERHRDLLDCVDRPSLLHFDTWDGNVLAASGPDGVLRLTGLVDGERYLYGDPVMDLVSLALFRRIEDEPSHPALTGYADARGAALVLDAPTVRRLALYRMHLYLLMIVEMPSRGNRPSPSSTWYRHLSGLLDEQLTELGREVPQW